MVEMRGWSSRQGQRRKKNLRIPDCGIVGDDEKLLGGRTESASSE